MGRNSAKERARINNEETRLKNRTFYEKASEGISEYYLQIIVIILILGILITLTFYF